jgi:hypothetical protein
LLESQLNTHKAFLQGLILLGLILFAIFLLHDQGLVSVLLDGDKSYISWAIIGIWALMSLRWLYLLFWVQQQTQNRASLATQPVETTEIVLMRWLNHGWFASDALLKLGLLGTIVGFIFMLAPIANLTSYEPASLQSALGQMSGGMAVALYTTLAGLIGNILLRIQFQFLADAMQTLLLHVARDHEQGDDTHKEPSTK